MSVIVWEYLAAYLGACCFGGWLVVGALLWLMRRLIGLDTKGSFDLSVLLLGSTERVVALTLVLHAPSYLPGFIGGWVLLKFALGWQASMSNKDHPKKDQAKNQQGSMLAMIGNVLSFAIAITAGVYLYPDVLKVWAATAR